MKKIFDCPVCGTRGGVSVHNMKTSVATVSCWSCRVSKQVPKNSLAEPLDVFGDFIDLYYKIDLDNLKIREEKKTTGIKREKTIKEVFGEETGYLEF